MRFLALALFAAFGCAAQGGEAPVAEEGNLPPRSMTLQELDQQIAGFKAAMWMTQPPAGYAQPDASGATFSTDLAKYAFSDTTLVRIDRLRDEIAKTTSGAISEAALAPMDRLISVEACHVMHVTLYWQMRQVRSYHEDMIRALIARLPPADRDAFTMRLAELDQGAAATRTVMESGVARCESQSTREWAEEAESIKRRSAIQDYNKLRLDIAATFPRPGNTIAGLQFIQRSAPCTAPVLPDGPQYRVASRRDVADFYPPTALLNEIEGRVVVVVAWDATGCVVSVATGQSSGSELLDNAAMQYGFGMVFQPGEENGKPVGGMVNAPVVFRLYE